LINKLLHPFESYILPASRRQPECPDTSHPGQFAPGSPCGSLFKAILIGLTLLSSGSHTQFSKTPGSRISRLHLCSELAHMLRIFLVPTNENPESKNYSLFSINSKAPQH
jgi:hypothetical protein